MGFVKGEESCGFGVEGKCDVPVIDSASLNFRGMSSAEFIGLVKDGGPVEGDVAEFAVIEVFLQALEDDLLVAEF